MFFDIIAGVVLALIIAIAAFLDGYYYGISDNRAEVEHWVERYDQVEEWRAQTSQLLLKSEQRRVGLAKSIKALPEYQYGTDSIRRSDVLHLISGGL